MCSGIYTWVRYGVTSELLYINSEHWDAKSTHLCRQLMGDTWIAVTSPQLARNQSNTQNFGAKIDWHTGRHTYTGTIVGLQNGEFLAIKWAGHSK